MKKILTNPTRRFLEEMDLHQLAHIENEDNEIICTIIRVYGGYIYTPCETGKETSVFVPVARDVLL
jgi:hypothetical protein